MSKYKEFIKGMSSFIEGFESILDLSGEYSLSKYLPEFYFRKDLTGAQNDALALRSDFETIGQDFYKVINKLEKNLDE